VDRELRHAVVSRDRADPARGLREPRRRSVADPDEQDPLRRDVAERRVGLAAPRFPVELVGGERFGELVPEGGIEPWRAWASSPCFTPTASRSVAVASSDVVPMTKFMRRFLDRVSGSRST
jgi:hypothetical protein